jgi:hypothetical protein
MKYRIPETIIIEQNDTETIKDIIYHELNEQALENIIKTEYYRLLSKIVLLLIIAF